MNMRAGMMVVAGLAAVMVLAGCGANARTMQPGAQEISLSGGGSTIDTNCTGCNGKGAHGTAAQRFSAEFADGVDAPVVWSVSGGDAKGGAGTIDAEGRYTPPGFLTADRVDVTVTARLEERPEVSASERVTVTPGFLEPLSPENVALGPGGSIQLTGRLAEAGGHAAIQFSVAGSPSGGEGGTGTVSTPECERGGEAFTLCTVTYTAPAVVDAPQVTYVVASAGGTGSGSRTEMAILLNPAGVSSNPLEHRAVPAATILLGGSGGNNGDFDASGSAVADCCGGTLGALVEDGTGRQYVLSNNHVLARSDHAVAGDAVVQPGLIDNNCTPNGDGPGTSIVASLSGWLPLKMSQTNVDAAIAQVGSRTLAGAGGILELGARQSDGTLASAAPGISSTGGRGETAKLRIQVAKSGRTTGLTCGSVAAIDVDVAVDYFEDCAETHPYLTKLFTNQIGLSGDRFSDAGDSGALVVDAATAEPVGLFFAGGADAEGVVQGVANPAPEVLHELDSIAGTGGGFRFSGGDDHGVSCLSYGDSAVAGAQKEPLSTVEWARTQQALFVARGLVNAAQGVLGVAAGKSSDHAGEGAVIVYVDAAKTPNVPAFVSGVRTVVIAATAQQVALGTAPMDNGGSAMPELNGTTLSRALEVKQRNAATLMRGNAAIFGVGVGQSLDNPREAVLVVYVDRGHLPVGLPESVDGVRTRYVVMDRLHVTRSYAATRPAPRCAAAGLQAN